MSVQALGGARATAYEVPPAPTSSGALSHIPGDDGWPILGHTLPLLADPKGFVERRAQRFGLVYRSRAFGQSNVSLLGPQANELVLLDSQKTFSSGLGWDVILHIRAALSSPLTYCVSSSDDPRLSSQDPARINSAKIRACDTNNAGTTDVTM